MAALIMRLTTEKPSCICGPFFTEKRHLLALNIHWGTFIENTNHNQLIFTVYHR
jgi:hypothetical protein